VRGQLGLRKLENWAKVAQSGELDAETVEQSLEVAQHEVVAGVPQGVAVYLQHRYRHHRIDHLLADGCARHEDHPVSGRSPGVTKMSRSPGVTKITRCHEDVTKMSRSPGVTKITRCHEDHPVSRRCHEDHPVQRAQYPVQPSLVVLPTG